MSTKTVKTVKDGSKTSNVSNSKKKIVQHISTTKRDASTDRRTKKVEVQSTIKPIVKKINKEESEEKLKSRSTTSKIIKKPIQQTGSNLKKSTVESRDKTVKQVSTRTKAVSSTTSTKKPPGTMKTQFFPSKTMYSNALKREDYYNDASADSREAIKTKLVSKPVKIKTKQDSSSDTSSISERPRTATLRRGSIVNHNIVGPEAPRSKLSTKPPSPDGYEDDFESYESDFEAYSSSSISTTPPNLSDSESSSSSTSTPLEKSSSSPIEFQTKRSNSAGTDSDERKLDSGNYELPEYKHKQLLDNIKESIEKENLKTASLSDEGFEESKSLQYINFIGAKKKNEHRKSLELKRKRGDEILSMIRLDTYSFTLLDLPAVPYEIFIKNFGKSNSLQVSTQTGDDDVDECIQTDEIFSTTKWTQYPTKFSKIDMERPSFWEIYKSEFRGVGVIEDNQIPKPVDNTADKVNQNNLDKFILSAGKLILEIQAESSSADFESLIEKEGREIPFSLGRLVLDTKKPILQNCKVQFMAFSENNSNSILTIHVKQVPDSAYQSVICFWDISYSVEEPKVYLMSHSYLNCCAFDLNRDDLIYGGHVDGVISVWNLNESVEYRDSINNTLALLASVTTEICSGHESKIVSIQPFQDVVNKILDFTINQTNQILSLDEDGELISWDIYVNKEDMGHKGLSQWGNTIIIKKFHISLKKLHPELVDMQCTDFIINNLNTNSAYISTNYGFIINYNLNGVRSNVKKYSSEIHSRANCLEMCPFSENNFLAGFSDGNINLYSRLVEKPLMVLSNKENQDGGDEIQLVRWSRNLPFILYSLDNKNTLHIWNLNESDIFPIYSVPFKENISCLRLSPLMEIDGNREKRSYMMIGTDEGLLYLHLFNTDHGIQSKEVYEQHKNTFLKYVNRL